MHPENAAFPNEQAIVMVREGHGAIGLKHAWPDSTDPVFILGLVGEQPVNVAETKPRAPRHRPKMPGTPSKPGSSLESL
jgi:hypothetical protein